MIYLFHGDDIGESRRALLDLRKNYPAEAVSVFDPEDWNINQFLRVLDTPAMFSERRLIITEGKLPQATILSVREKLEAKRAASATDLAFWVGEALKPSDKLLGWVKEQRGEIRHFKKSVPEQVFGFLDALGYKERQKAFLELHRLLDRGESPVYLLTMITWQIRNLLNVKYQNSNVKKMKPYVLRKAQSQARNFGEGELVLIFKKLLAAEKTLKTTSRDPVLILDQLVYDIVHK